MSSYQLSIFQYHIVFNCFITESTVSRVEKPFNDWNKVIYCFTSYAAIFHIAVKISNHSMRFQVEWLDRCEISRLIDACMLLFLTVEFQICMLDAAWEIPSMESFCLLLRKVLEMLRLLMYFECQGVYSILHIHTYASELKLESLILSVLRFIVRFQCCWLIRISQFE